MAATLPRVTAILEATGLGPDLSVVPPEVLERARRRGQLVHEAVEALIYGFFDAAAHDPDGDLVGYLEAYHRFLAESKFSPVVAELEVVHEAWRYRGHPDVVGFLGAHRALLDFKSGLLGLQGVEYQLAGYVEAWNHQRPHERVTTAAAIELRRDGSYRFHEADLTAATPVWYAAVTVYYAQQQRRAA